MLILRGATLTFRADPFLHEEQACLRYERNGAVAIENGKILSAGDADAVLGALPPQEREKAETVHYKDSIILPGFIDAHTHYSQTDIIGAYGLQLIDWLNQYTFPAERNFADKNHASQVAAIFLQEALKNGITTCSAFCTVFPQSVDALFDEAAKLGLRIIAGKVCMDRNAPDWLTDTPKRAYDESRELILKWHGKGRAEYTLTPRFAPTSSPEQLEALGALAAEFPSLPIQSHISENMREVAWVKEVFPQSRDYTDVYDSFGLLRPRAVYGHGIHLTERELAVFYERGASIAHCPTSNMFIGSGCFNAARAKQSDRPVRVGLGTDIGAGTSFSMLQTLNEAYKAAQLGGTSLSAAKAFYLATRGSAEALGIEDKVGSIEPGMEADLTVLDLKSTPLITRRMEQAESIQDTLFIQLVLGDDRAVRDVYSGGEIVYKNRP